MSRNIIVRRQGQNLKEDEAAISQPDNYTSQIVKLIPVEVVGIYLGISNLIDGFTKPISNAANNAASAASTVNSIDKSSIAPVQWIIFILITVITPFYLSKAAGVTDKRQIIIATFSFVVWAISLGGPFSAYFDPKLQGGLTVKILGGILIMIYSLIVPIFYKKSS